MLTLYDLAGIACLSVISGIIDEDLMYLPVLMGIVDIVDPLRAAAVGFVAVLFVGTLRKFIKSGR